MLFLWKAIFPQSSSNTHEERSTLDGLRAHMEGSYSAHAEQETMDCEASVDVESRWKSFVQLLNSGIEKFIPSKIAKQKNHLPVTMSQRN